MPSSTRTTVAAPLNAAKPALEDFGPEEQLLRTGRRGSSPTVPTVPLARRHRHQYETFTVWLLHSWACPTAAGRRAQGGEAAVNRRTVGVGGHSLTRLATHLKIFFPTKVASPDAMGCSFRREESGFTSNSRACRRQLRLWSLDAVKAQLVTGKRRAAKTGHGAGSAGAGTVNEQHAHGPRRFTARAACKA